MNVVYFLMNVSKSPLPRSQGTRDKTTRSILVELVSLLRQLHFLMNFIRIDTLHCFYYLDEHLVSCFDVAPFGVDLAIGGEKGRRSWSLRKKGCFIKEISC